MKTFFTIMVVSLMLPVTVNAYGQDELPEDVSRLLPSAKPRTAKPPKTQANNGPSDSLDQRFGRALLRYKNIAEQTRGLNERWQADVEDRLKRIDEFLETLTKETAKSVGETKQEGQAAARRPVRRVAPETGPTSVEAPPVEQTRTLPATKLSAPNKNPTGVPSDANVSQAVQMVDSVECRARQLDALATWCEGVARDLRQAAKNLREGSMSDGE